MSRAEAGGRHLDVLELAETILARNPWDVAAQEALARSAVSLGLLEVAIWALEQARQVDSMRSDLHRALARLHERKGNFHQARTLWERILQVHPNDAEAGARLQHLSGHRVPGSSPEIPISPTDPVEREAAELRQSIDVDPTIPAGHLALARLYREAGRYEQAHQVLATGLGPTGHSFDLAVEMASLAIEPAKRDLAITLAKLAETPKDHGLLEIQSNLVREVLTREVDLYRLKSDRHPGDLRSRYELGMRLLMLGQVEEAIRELQQACAAEQERWRSLAALGHCWLAWANPARAVCHFEDALSFAPTDIPARLDILYEAACCHAQLGALERAVERGAELAELAPDHRDILQLLPGWQARVRPAS